MARKEKSEKKGVGLDEDGGETLSLIILSNGITKFVRHVTITGDKNPGKNRAYVTDDGRVINHNRESGFIQLAKKILSL